MQFSNQESELYMENATSAQTDPGTDYMLHGWPVREGNFATVHHHTLTAGEVTLLGADDCRRLTMAIAALLNKYFQNATRVLLVGLGNGGLTADRLGTAVCQRLTLGGVSPGQRTLYSLVPGVSAITGIPTDRLVARTAETIQADWILAVDALCARSAVTLGKVVQLSDVGMTPGSGTVVDTAEPISEEYPPEISSRTMPCPVVTMGVPTVIRTTLPDGGDMRYLVTAGDTDRTVERWSTILAAAILQTVMQSK